MLVYDQFSSKFIIKTPIDSVWNQKIGKNLEKTKRQKSQNWSFWGSDLLMVVLDARKHVKSD